MLQCEIFPQTIDLIGKFILDKKLLLAKGKIIISKGNNISNTIVNTTSKDFHIVEKGETLYRISVNNNLSVNRLKELNQLSDNTILVGQRLKLK